VFMTWGEVGWAVALIRVLQKGNRGF